MLSMSEMIAKDKTQPRRIGQVLSNFIFDTLSHTAKHAGSRAEQATAYSICQGWLDIMVAGKPGRIFDVSASQVAVKMGIEDLAAFLEKSAKFLAGNLNLGSFEGSGGAKKPLVMDLSLAQDMLLVSFNLRTSDDASVPAITEIIKKLDESGNEALEAKFCKALDLLMTWLFLNARDSEEKTD
jgi:hypothetical protein